MKTFSRCAATFGVLVVTVLKMLTRTRKRVTRRAIRPGITSIGMRKEIQDTITNRPEVETRDEERPLKVLLFLANRWITGVNKKQARGEF